MLQEYIDKFAIPGKLSFAENEFGLIYATITTDPCNAKIFLQGAHLVEWCPSGSEPVFFLSDKSLFEPGKVIRGGVPIIFPWFGSRTANQYSTRTDGPSHGFARTSTWQISEATVSDGKVNMTLTLEPNEASRALGFDNFVLKYKIVFGKNLALRLTVENTSSEPFIFEEALHSYFSVGDARQISIYGLVNTDYLDKTDEFKHKTQTENILALTGETDRPYINTKSTVYIQDPLKKRRLVISKENSATTVVWNPWIELSAKLADLGDDVWQQMVCVETANALVNAIELPPGKSHTMSAQIASNKTA